MSVESFFWNLMVTFFAWNMKAFSNNEGEARQVVSDQLISD